MSNFYLDTCALVATYAQEIHTESIRGFLTSEQPNIFISRLTETEFYSALANKKRTKQLSIAQVVSIQELFKNHIKMELYKQVLMSDSIFSLAIDFLITNKTNLRTLDALHLAFVQANDLTLITADQVFAKAAKHFGISVKSI